MRIAPTAAVLALVALAAPAAAQQEIGVPTVEVEDARVGAAVDPADATPFVTVLDVRGGASEVRTLAETLAESAGVKVRSLGGLGAYSAVSIRGSSSAEVAVFLDGVPLNRGALGGVDLSLLPLDALERIEIYRGQAPPELGGQAVGGAINLVTRRARGSAATLASASVGSFGARKLDLYRGVRPGAWEVTVFLSYMGADGDFPFRNANGTTQNPNDDFADTRRNNDFDQLDGHLALARRAAGRELRLGAHAFWKEQGVPGNDHTRVVAAHLGTLRATLDGHATRDAAFGRPELSLGGDAYLVAERRHFRDPDPAELGGVFDLVDWNLAGGATGRAALALGTHQIAKLLPEVHLERFDETALAGGPAGPGAFRVAGALTLADDVALCGDALLVEPALRLDAIRTRGPAGSQALAIPGAGTLERDDLEPSPRLGARWRTPLAGLSVKANVGRYFRLPTFYDLYANLGYFVGRPDLRPESSVNADGGLVFERTGLLRLGRLFAELGYFESHTDDLIVYTPGFRFTSPVNVPGSTGRGLEAALALGPSGGMALSANYTFLDLRYDDSGRHVAGRPVHEAYARLDGDRKVLRRRLRAATLGGYYEVRATAGLYADPANALELPLRTYHAVGLRAGAWGLTLTFEIKNLLDATEEMLARPNSACPAWQCPQAIEDFGGYPLPGRALYLTLAWKE